MLPDPKNGRQTQKKTGSEAGSGYSIGRGGGIRTRDPLHPMQVRYQAALRPDTGAHYSSCTTICQRVGQDRNKLSVSAISDRSSAVSARNRTASCTSSCS
jgi:hypothetical protein